MKEVLFSSEARNRIKKGVDEAANAAKVTLGPRGRNVILSSGKHPQITNDGVTIIKEMDSVDEYTKLGINLIKQVAENADKKGGDGTTTASLLAQEMITRGMKLVDSGHNPVLLREGMDMAMTDILEAIDLTKRDVEGYEDCKNIATISSGDERVGKLIAEAFKAIGKEGAVNVGPASGYYDEVEIVKGFRVNKGYLSPYLISDSETMEYEAENPKILITDQQITSLRMIAPLLEQISESGSPLLIICSSIQEEALGAMVTNKLNGLINVCAIEAPGFGDRRENILEDIAVLTGGTFISKAKGLDITVCNGSMKMLGTCSKVLVKNDETIFYGVGGTEEDIQKRIESIKVSKENTVSQYEADKMKERMGMLAGGVAVIKIGAVSDLELRERKLRIEDAINATRGALEEGVIPGGGVTLMRIGASRDLREKANNLIDELGAGYAIVLDSIEKPFRQILENSGMRPDEYRFKVLNDDNFSIGVDAKWKRITDMYQAGIIDPATVTKSSLSNAVSVAAVLMTTEAAIVPISLIEEQA